MALNMLPTHNDKMATENNFIVHNVIFSSLPAFCMIYYRHVLAAIYFNKNLRRDIKTTEKGEKQIRIMYPKFKNGEATVRDVRVQQNFGKN